MTLKKDDKTVVKKQKSKAKVWLKPKREEEKGKDMPKRGCPAKEESSMIDPAEEGERKDWDDDDDSSSSGPSGKTFSPEEREKNLQELYRQQRNFLRRVLVDTDDEEEEEKQEEDSEEQNTLE